MNPHRKRALPIVAAAWEGSYGHTFGAHLNAEERAITAEAALREIHDYAFDGALDHRVARELVATIAMRFVLPAADPSYSTLTGDADV